MWWSYALGIIGVFGIWLAGRKSSAGWAIGFGSQFLWFTYAIVSEQYGFLITAIGYGTVYARNWWKWTHERAAVQEPSS